MKKLAIGMLVILFTAPSCRKNENQNKNQKPLTVASTSLITLNGISETAAIKMMQRFQLSRGNDVNPTKTSVWFDSTTVHRMHNLLRSEGADGIRIYFISDTGETGGHLKNSVALVSTKANGTDISVPSGMRHQDYYQHAANDVLFSNLKAISGTVSYYNGENEAVLYKTCNTCEVERANLSNNIHHISRQVAEQMVQHFGDHPINTISEWFNIGMFEAFANDKTHDGIRIYFATKPNDGSQNSLSDAFVFTKTVPGIIPNTHADDLRTNNLKANGIADSGGQDNGEQCPANCNGITKL